MTPILLILWILFRSDRTRTPLLSLVWCEFKTWVLFKYWETSSKKYDRPLLYGASVTYLVCMEPLRNSYRTAKIGPLPPPSIILSGSIACFERWWEQEPTSMHIPLGILQEILKTILTYTSVYSIWFHNYSWKLQLLSPSIVIFGAGLLTLTLTRHQRPAEPEPETASSINDQRYDKLSCRLSRHFVTRFTNCSLITCVSGVQIAWFAENPGNEGYSSQQSISCTGSHVVFNSLTELLHSPSSKQNSLKDFTKGISTLLLVYCDHR